MTEQRPRSPPVTTRWSSTGVFWCALGCAVLRSRLLAVSASAVVVAAGLATPLVFASPSLATSGDSALLAALQGVPGLLPQSADVPVSSDADSAVQTSTGDLTADVPRDPTQGVDLTGDSGLSLTVTPSGAGNAADAAVIAPGVAGYAGSAIQADSAVQVLPNGARLLSVMYGPLAPTRFDFPLLLTPGETLQPSGTGYTIVAASGATDAVIDPPWAMDADHAAVPASYELSGSTLTLVVDATNATYPVVADPTVLSSESSDNSAGTSAVTAQASETSMVAQQGVPSDHMSGAAATAHKAPNSPSRLKPATAPHQQAASQAAACSDITAAMANQMAQAGQKSVVCSTNSGAKPPAGGPQPPPPGTGAALAAQTASPDNGFTPGEAAEPSYCATAAGSPQGVYINDRYGACAVYYDHFVVQLLPSMQIVGGGSVQQVTWAQLNPSQRSWLWVSNINMYYAWGDAVTGSWIWENMACSTLCSIFYSTPATGWAPLTEGQPMTGAWSINGNLDNFIDEMAQRQDAWIWNDASPNTMAYFPSIQVPDTRCDSEPYIASQNMGNGCVFPNKWLWWTDPRLSLTGAAPAGVNNVWQGQNLPDHFGACYTIFCGLPLQRLYRQDVVSQNRTAACAGWTSNGTGSSVNQTQDSCDEYPFASTYQGAALIGPGRNIAGHVPLNQNSIVGTWLGGYGGFLANNRVVEGEPYYILVRS